MALLDPRDQYVQLYVPVADLGRVRVGQRVAIELDSEPGRRVPGEISFIADRANFTPEKIETRDDRLGQVYRAKVRILETWSASDRAPRATSTSRRRPRALMTAAAPAIRLRQLSKRFGARAALAGIDLALSGAHLVGIVGPDGAARRRCCARSPGCSRSRRRPRGVGLRSARRRAAAQGRVGYVPQAFSLPRDCR
jgi:hypothetical protein